MGNGKSSTETISISVPSDLIPLLDKVCHMEDRSRSSLVTRAIRKHLAAKLCDDPEIMAALYQAITEPS